MPDLNEYVDKVVSLVNDGSHQKAEALLVELVAEARKNAARRAVKFVCGDSGYFILRCRKVAENELREVIEGGEQ